MVNGCSMRGQGHRQTMNVRNCRYNDIFLSFDNRMYFTEKLLSSHVLCSTDEIGISDLEYRYFALCFLGYLSKCHILLCIANMGISSQ